MCYKLKDMFLKGYVGSHIQLFKDIKKSHKTKAPRPRGCIKHNFCKIPVQNGF